MRDEAPLKPAAEYQIVGTSVPRVFLTTASAVGPVGVAVGGTIVGVGVTGVAVGGNAVGLAPEWAQQSAGLPLPGPIAAQFLFSFQKAQPPPA